MPKARKIPDDAKLMRRAAVEESTQHRKTKIYKLIKLGIFPKPVRLGPRSVAWWSHEIDEYNRSHPRA